MHRVLYIVANTSSMNGVMPGSAFKEAVRTPQKLIIRLNILFALLILWLAYVIFRGFKPSLRKLNKLVEGKTK